jgi:hypothetical protein
MNEIWLLVFLFKGAIYASGPYDLDACREMAEAQASAVCVNKDMPRIRVTVPRSRP